MVAGSSNTCNQYHEMIDKIAIKQAKYFDAHNKSNVLSYEDFYSEAWVGALEALKRYDPSRGPAESFLDFSVRRHLIKYANNNLSHIKVASRTIGKCVNIWRMRIDGIETSEISKQLKMTELQIIQHEGLLNVGSIERLTTKQVNSLYTVSQHGFTVSEIYDFLAEKFHDVVLLDEYIKRKTIKEIAVSRNKSPENIRIKLIAMMDEIKGYLKDDE
jgi:DNA-directed RNA polymerase specialized sigma subunit